MSNDDYRRTSDDAYDDLMDSYFNQGRSKGTNRASGSSNQKLPLTVQGRTHQGPVLPADSP